MPRPVSTPHTPEALLERYAAAALDWPAVRELLLPSAASPLGARALMELAPLEPGAAREALCRSREVAILHKRGVEPPLGGAPDPLPVLENALRYSRILGGPELVDVARLLRLATDLGAWLRERRSELSACAALWADLPELSSLRAALEAALDTRGELQDGASELLRRLRRGIEEHTSRLDGLLRELGRKPALRSAFADGQAGRVVRRGGRRVFAVRRRQAGRVPGIVHDHSQSGETVFVEPREAVELGNALATMEADAEREINRILSELTHAVLLAIEPLTIIGDRIGTLELALISARYGARIGGGPARLPGEDGATDELLLRGWRHPLLLEEEALGHIEQVAPIDVRLGEAFDLLVITGPNTGGKTLALKSAGLAALLTSMGLAIPAAAGSTVPLYDGIVADIGDEQEIQQNLSTFSSHLQRIQRGLARATPRTLFLLDELGGGTDPSEGAALGAAVLERLLERRVPTLASTHLGQLKELAFRLERVENAHVEFDEETLAPSYTLVIGAPGRSHALVIARGLGLDADLVDRAEESMERSGDDAELLMEEMRAIRMDAERMRGEAESRLLDLERREGELQARGDSVEARRAQLDAEAQRGLEERVAQARPWLERARALLPQLEKKQRPPLAEVLDGLDAALTSASLTERRSAFLASLKKGDLVWVPRFKKRCKVLRLFRSREELAVRVGSADMTVSMRDVTFYESL